MQPSRCGRVNYNVGSITSRCSGKWAHAHPSRGGTKTGLERAAGIEPNYNAEKLTTTI